MTNGSGDGVSRPPEDPRVRFAAERTLLAWVRTGLGLMGFGFVVARFGLFLREIQAGRPGGAAEPPHTGASLWIGVALVALGVAVTLASAWNHLAVLRRLDRGEPYSPPAWSLGLAVALVLALVGVAMAAYLLLVGR